VEREEKAVIDGKTVEAFRKDGAALVKGAFSDWVDVIAAGIDRNVREPGPYASTYALQGEPGCFFDDYCNWERIPEFVEVVRRSPAADIARQFMASDRAQFFHDHVLVKEAGAQKVTPWHQDLPYYFTEGRQTVSFWIPVDPVREATLRLIAGSHLWEKWVRPVRWLNDASFFAKDADYLPVPDPDRDPAMTVLEWAMEPGDAVVFDFRTVHGARGNTASVPRRVLSLRWVGDDVRYAERPGPTSPPYPGHGMRPGERLREDWFPVIGSAG
jgi:ectoine hydroxylase-related dioxygenase (phytanoyl-CoA dioxygenase family)